MSTANSSNLTIVGLFFVAFLVKHLVSGNCRSLKFRTIIKGKALANHTIRTIEPIRDDETCKIQCYLEPLCFAVNNCQKDGIEAVCELLNNTATIIHDNQDLVHKQECTVYISKNSCSSSPCPSNASCHGDFLSDPVPYKCICPSGFTGVFCESDIDECALNTDACSLNATCVNLIGSYDCTCKSGLQGNGRNCHAFANCSQLLSAGYTADGVYHIDPDGQGSFPVYCDMTTDGGDWTVFQRNRKDTLMTFNRTWQEYKTGFGDQNDKYWLGLDKIYRLTRTQVASLRVDLEDVDGNKRYAVYSSFSLADESDFYRLHVSGYSGTAGDSLRTARITAWISNGMMFSTRDKDNDRWTDSNCAANRLAGWWF